MIRPSRDSSDANHSRDNGHDQLSSETLLDLDPTMSTTAKETRRDHQEHDEDTNTDNDDAHADEHSKLVPTTTSNDLEEHSPSIATSLRSILRKRAEKTTPVDLWNNVHQTSITLNENVNDHADDGGDDGDDGGDGNDNGEDDDDERDSHYTGDENEEEKDDSNKSKGKKAQNNEQQRCRNYSRHQRANQFVRTSLSHTLVSPLDTETGLTETRVSTTTTTTTASTALVYETDQSSTRPTCVTFTKDQPIIIHRSSSTPQLAGLTIQPRSSITYINMKDDVSAVMPITTTTTTTTLGSSATLGAEFRPVYVSPLKYRPLVGLSANDSRLLLEKRVSLLGRPLVFHPIQKRSPSYRRTQLHIYNFLERPHGYKAILYHTFVFLTVFLCLFLSVVVTMPDYEHIASTVLLQTEIIVVVWLATELGLRVWSSGCRSRYQTKMGRLRFMRKPFCVLDFIMIMATVVTLCLNSRGGNGAFAASALRGLRFFQILRMLRMDRRGGTWKLLGSVVYAHRQELITTIYIGFLVLIFSSFIMFLVEKDVVVEPRGNGMGNMTNGGSMPNYIDTDRHKFETFADALWWGIITLCTVGYGDKVPSSYLGKLIAAICSFIGISFFALPAGILGSGFALKVQQQQRQKHYKRRKIPAVLLIQNLWRVYAADEKSLSKATWKVHVRPPRKDTHTSSTQQPNANPVSFRMRNNQSFLNRVSFRRRTPTRDTSSTTLNNLAVTNDPPSKPAPNSAVAAMRSCLDTLTDTASITRTTSMIVPHETSSSDTEDDHFYFANDVQSLTLVHRHAIRFVRKAKYYVARRKFREALRPYDVTDVIEQYSTGNVDMLARMKYLQARLDKVLGISKSVDSYESGPSLASRICKIESQVDGLDGKVDRLCQLTNTLLERAIRQQAPVVTAPHTQHSTAPIVIHRIRTYGNRFHYCRRQRRTGHRATITNATAHAHAPVENRSPTDSFRSSPDQPLVDPAIAQSRESLVSLYWLFQENISSSSHRAV